MLWMFAESTVVIWRRCTSDTRPAGCMMNTSMASRSRHASMAAEPVSPEVAPTMVTRVAPSGQLVVEQAADQLEGDVLERQRGPVEQLHQPQAVAEVAQGRHRRIVERGVGVGDQRGELVALERDRRTALDERPHDLDGDVDVGLLGEPGQRPGRERRPGLGEVEPAVAGEAGQQDVAELEDGRRAPGAHVLHDAALRLRRRAPG